MGTYFVDTDVVGGDSSGSSWANAFANLSVYWALNRDLVSLTESDTVNCRGVAVDSNNVPNNSGTSSATYDITIVGDCDMSLGRIDTSAYRLSTGAAGRQFDCRQVTHFKNFQAIGLETGVSAECLSFGTGAAGSTVTDCITKGEYYGISSNVNITVQNTICYENQRSGLYSYGGTITADNVVIYNCAYRGVYVNGGAIVCTNVISHIDSGGSAAYAGATGNYNAGGKEGSTDTTAPGANSVDSIASANEFVSITDESENFHIGKLPYC